MLVNRTRVTPNNLRGPFNRTGLQVYVNLLVLECWPLDSVGLVVDIEQASLLFDLLERVHSGLGFFKKFCKEDNITIRPAVVFGQLVVPAVENSQADLKVT